MKKFLICTIVAGLLVTSAQFTSAKSRSKTAVPTQVGYFLNQETLEVVPRLPATKAKAETKEPRLLQVAYQDTPPAVPTSVHSETVVSSGPAIELFHCVKYEDLRNIHPCAVSKIVSVLDPCPQTCCNSCGTSSCDTCNSCCPKGCVFVEICVPPCGCPEVKVSRKGSKVKYDYGSYEVEITSRNGVVKVDYDD